MEVIMAKDISLVGSNMALASIERDAADNVFVTVVGHGLDADGNPIPSKNLVIQWGDLPPNVQNVADTFLKHLSREFNKFVANEDSDTW
jgi:hypothetical protein